MYVGAYRIQDSKQYPHRFTCSYVCSSNEIDSFPGGRFSGVLEFRWLFDITGRWTMSVPTYLGRYTMNIGDHGQSASCLLTYVHMKNAV